MNSDPTESQRTSDGTKTARASVSLHARCGSVFPRYLGGMLCMGGTT